MTRKPKNDILKKVIDFFEIVNFLKRKRKEIHKMRTSMEKVKPEWSYFCMSWKNDQRKSYFKETLLYVTQ